MGCGSCGSGGKRKGSSNRRSGSRKRSRRSRPKRPLHGYNIFVRKYARDQKKQCKELSGPEIICGASKAWNKLSKKEQQSYGKKGCKGKAQYEVELAKYNQELQLMKAPPNAYALFLRDFWHDNSGQFHELCPTCKFSHINQSCADAWNALSAEDKKRYEDEHKRLSIVHNQIKTALANGANINDFLQVVEQTLVADSDENKNQETWNDEEEEHEDSEDGEDLEEYEEQDSETEDDD